jgi:shikimate kinase
MAKPIFLLGFMGSGKTSIGRKLANNLNLNFFDLDLVIEEKFQKSITELFAEEGEKAFRIIENESLHKICSNSDCVISLGGGTPCFENNMKLIKNTGTSVYLKLDESILVGRLRLKKEKRPLIAKLSDQEISNFVQERLKEREVFYKQADFILESNHPKVVMIADLLNTEV